MMAWHFRLRRWLIERETEKLRRKINRPYTQSQFQLNPSKERGIHRTEVISGLMIVFVLIVILYIESH